MSLFCRSFVNQNQKLPKTWILKILLLEAKHWPVMCRISPLMSFSSLRNYIVFQLTRFPNFLQSENIFRRQCFFSTPRLSLPVVSLLCWPRAVSHLPGSWHEMPRSFCAQWSKDGAGAGFCSVPPGLECRGKQLCPLGEKEEEHGERLFMKCYAVASDF